MTAAETGFGLAYAMTAILAAVAAARRRAAGSREAWAWLLVAVALVLFAALRLTAIHEDAIASVRELARQQGWYEQRKALQGSLLQVLLASAVLVMLLFTVAIRTLRPAILTAVTGVTLLGMLSAARAMSFHRLDYVLQRPLGPLNLAQFEELVLLLFTGGASLVAATKKGAATQGSRALGRLEAEEA